MASIIDEHKIDTIIHFGAETNVRESFPHPEMHFHSNVLGTYAMMEALRKLPEVRFHLISSRIKYPESIAPLEPDAKMKITSPYAGTKACSDILAETYEANYDLKISSSLTANVYGSEKNGALLNIVAEKCLEEEPIQVHGDGMHLRQRLFEDDHTDAVYMLANDPKNREMYFIGAEDEIPNITFINHVIDAMAKQQGKPVQFYRDLIEHVDDVSGNIRGGMLNTSKIRQKYGWRPQTPLQKGIEVSIRRFIAKHRLKKTT